MPTASFRFERAILAQGYHFIAGVDEVGCGAWAGPVYAAAVILIPGKTLPDVHDSKTLSPAKRQVLYSFIKTKCLAWSIGVASVEEICQLNIRQASLLATTRALARLQPEPDWVLSDAFPVPGNVPCTPITRGDTLSKSIAAASILAKVERDAHMRELDEQYPGYCFAEHKGYGTRLHQAALKKFGPCPIHRVTYEPIQRVLQKI